MVSSAVTLVYSINGHWGDKPRVASNEPIVPFINVRADDDHSNVDYSPRVVLVDVPRGI